MHKATGVLIPCGISWHYTDITLQFSHYGESFVQCSYQKRCLSEIKRNICRLAGIKLILLAPNVIGFIIFPKAQECKPFSLFQIAAVFIHSHLTLAIFSHVMCHTPFTHPLLFFLLFSLIISCYSHAKSKDVFILLCVKENPSCHCNKAVILVSLNSASGLPGVRELHHNG